MFSLFLSLSHFFKICLFPLHVALIDNCRGKNIGILAWTP